MTLVAEPSVAKAGEGPGAEEAEVVAAGSGGWGAKLTAGAQGKVGDFFEAVSGS